MRYAIFCLTCLVAAATAGAATPQPTTEPTVGTFIQSDIRLSYQVPASWQAVNASRNGGGFLTAKSNGSISITLLPATTRMTPEFKDQMLQNLRTVRSKSTTTTVITEPTVEPDDRFALKIHEQFKGPGPKKEIRAEDDWLVCRVVGDRVVMMSVKAVDPSQDAVKAIEKSAEEALLSMSVGGADKAGAAALGTLGQGLVTYVPPADWLPGKTTPNVVSYITPAHDGILAIQLLPTDMQMSPEARDAIVKHLQATRKKGAEKMLTEPTAETDDRFALRVHERYEVGRKDGTVKVADQVHLYRAVGPRFVMLTVNTLSDDPEVIKATQKAAEDVLLSAALHRPGSSAKPPQPAKPAAN